MAIANDRTLPIKAKKLSFATGQASTGDGAGDTTDGDRRIVVSLKATSTVVQDQLGGMSK
jgi:hypothetical protein